MGRLYERLICLVELIKRVVRKIEKKQCHNGVLFLEHSICKDRLPQTFVAIQDGKAVGMYQLSMTDDLFGRPDVYPWLINVYVDEQFRGRNICRELMLTVRENAKNAGLKELYLYTKHVGLYEKFGWEFVEMVKTFDAMSPIERLYRLKV